MGYFPKVLNFNWFICNQRLALPIHWITHIRAASHYGRPSREVAGLSGQTLLRVQING
jgi:hypothetical protein